MTRFGHKLNYVINTFVKHTPDDWVVIFKHYQLKSSATDSNLSGKYFYKPTRMALIAVSYH